MKIKSFVMLNFYLSMGFGILMGLVFPIYANFFVEFKSKLAFSIFISGCILAGIIVGAVAFFISKITILRLVKRVNSELQGILSDEADLTQSIKFTSNDILGELIINFNCFIAKINKSTCVIYLPIQHNHNG